MTDEGVSRRTRWGVALYLVAFAGAGLAGAEAWPVTGWKLYAETSSEHQQVWHAVTVDGAGIEHVIDFQRLPVRFREGAFLLRDFPELSERRREDICRAWGEVLADRGADVAATRIYEVLRRVPTGDGDDGAAAVAERTLWVECPT